MDPRFWSYILIGDSKLLLLLRCPWAPAAPSRPRCQGRLRDLHLWSGRLPQTRKTVQNGMKNCAFQVWRPTNNKYVHRPMGRITARWLGSRDIVDPTTLAASHGLHVLHTEQSGVEQHMRSAPLSCFLYDIQREKGGHFRAATVIAIANWLDALAR